MKAEGGIDSGARDAGRGFGSLCLSAVPLALGIGAAVWLGAYVQAHEFFHLLSQEQRAAIYVASPDSPAKPKEHIQIQVIKRDCAEVERVDLDGGSIIVYGKNSCGKRLDYFEWHWQELSSNGTVIGEEYHNSASCPNPSEPGDIAECRMSIPDPDDRTKTVRVWVGVM